MTVFMLPYRLTSASGAYGAYTWTYDGVGNRKAENATPVGGSLTARTYTYNSAANKIANTKISGVTERTFVHDNGGNISSDTRSGVLYDYSYNKRNRLKTITVAGSLKVTYTYNGLEQLAIRVTTSPAATTHFIHDIFGNVIAETAGNGPTGATGTVREYIYLPETQIAPTMGSRTIVDRPLAVVDAVNTGTPVMWWVSVDHLHRPIKMTDGSKAAVWTAVWQPWGAPQSITGTATLDARFPGQWFQLDAGLHYNWHRHYDPTLGRYTQPDPLGFVDGPGLYVYADGSALVYVDEDGRYIHLLLGFALGAGLEYLLNPCADIQDILLSGALGALGSGAGGATMLKQAGKEFSHFIPKRLLPKNLQNNLLNGNYVSPKFHSQTDPFRLLKNQKKFGEHLFPQGMRQLLRTPAWIPGGAAGAAAGTIDNPDDCNC